MNPNHFPKLPKSWTQETLQVKSSDLTNDLFVTLWVRFKAAPRRILLITHGHGEHGGRYEHVPHYLDETVDAVVVYDHKGHGRSTGLRGHAERFDELTDDFSLMVEWAIKRFGPEARVAILGHSMGGLVLLRYLERQVDHPLVCATVSAPFLGIKAPVPRAKKIGAAILNRVLGTLKLHTALDPSGLSHDPELVKCYQQDRLVHDYMTPRFFSSLTQALFEMNQAAQGERALPGFRIPIQGLIPGADPIVDSAVSMAYLGRVQAPACEVKMYPELFHEILNELQKDQVFSDLKGWLSRYLV